MKKFTIVCLVVASSLFFAGFALALDEADYVILPHGKYEVTSFSVRSNSCWCDVFYYDQKKNKHFEISFSLESLLALKGDEIKVAAFIDDESHYSSDAEYPVKINGLSAWTYIAIKKKIESK